MEKTYCDRHLNYNLVTNMDNQPFDAREDGAILGNHNNIIAQDVINILQLTSVKCFVLLMACPEI